MMSQQMQLSLLDYQADFVAQLKVLEPFRFLFIYLVYKLDIYLLVCNGIYYSKPNQGAILFSQQSSLILFLD